MHLSFIFFPNDSALFRRAVSSHSTNLARASAASSGSEKLIILPESATRADAVVQMKDRSRRLSVIDHVVMAKINSSVTSIWRLTETFDSSFDSVFLFFSVRCRCAAFCSSTRFSSGSSCGGLFGFSFVSVVTESLLNLLGKLSEVNFRDSGLVYQHNAIWFDTAYLGVLVFAPFDGFEVLGECEGRGQCKLIVQFSSTSRRGRDSALLLSTRQRQSDINVRGTQAM